MVELCPTESLLQVWECIQKAHVLQQILGAQNQHIAMSMTMCRQIEVSSRGPIPSIGQSNSSGLAIAVLLGFAVPLSQCMRLEPQLHKGCKVLIETQLVEQALRAERYRAWIARRQRLVMAQQGSRSQGHQCVSMAGCAGRSHDLDTSTVF